VGSLGPGQSRAGPVPTLAASCGCRRLAGCCRFRSIRANRRPAGSRRTDPGAGRGTGPLAFISPGTAVI